MQARRSDSEVFGDFEGFRQTVDGIRRLVGDRDPSAVVMSDGFAWHLHILDCEFRSTLDWYLPNPRDKTAPIAMPSTDQEQGIARILDDCYNAFDAFFSDLRSGLSWNGLSDHATITRAQSDKLAAWWWAHHPKDMQKRLTTEEESRPEGPTFPPASPWSDIADAGINWKFQQNRDDHERQSAEPYPFGRVGYIPYNTRRAMLRGRRRITCPSPVLTEMITWSKEWLGLDNLSKLHASCDDLSAQLDLAKETDLEPFLQFLRLTEKLSDSTDSEGSSDVDTKRDARQAKLVAILRKTYTSLQTWIKSRSRKDTKQEVHYQLQSASDFVDDLAKSWLIEHGRLTADVSDGLDRDSLWQYVHSASSEAAPPSTE